MGRLPAYLVLACVLFVAYLPTFSGDFIFDDRTLIRDNPYVTKLHSLSSYLAQEDGIADERDRGVYHTGYYRPLMNFTYFIDYRLWGMKAAGFRITNWFFHLLTCLILYELMGLLTRRDVWPLLGALLFAVHPVQTEAVSMIVSRNNIFATCFTLVALFGYIRWWQKKSAPALTCSLIAFAGALSSKEIGFMALPILFLYQRFLSLGKDPKREFISYVPYLGVVAVYTLLRGHVVASAFGLPPDLGTRLFFVPYLVIYNLGLIFVPHGLHSFHVSYPQPLFAAPVILSFVLFCLLAIGAWRHRKERLLIFSTLAFLIALLPVLNVAAKASVSLIAMRWLYLPSAFLAVGLVWALGRVPVRRRGLALACGVLLIFYLGSYTYTLNRNLWHDEDTFLRQEVVHFGNVLYIGDYAEHRFQQGELGPAETYFALALQGKTAKARDYINYGALLVETGRPEGALGVLQQAAAMVMVNRDRADWHNNLGVALTMTGRLREAREHLKKALILDGQNPRVHRNFAILLSRQGRTAEADAHLNIMHQLQPNHEPVSK